MTREAIVTAFSELGEDLQGKGGLVGFIKRIGRNDLKTAGMLLRAMIPMQMTIEQKEEIVYQSVEQARADLERAGIPIDEVFQLEYFKGPVVDVEATDVREDGSEAHDSDKNETRR